MTYITRNLQLQNNHYSTDCSDFIVTLIVHLIAHISVSLLALLKVAYATPRLPMAQ